MGKRHPYITQDGEDFPIEFKESPDGAPRQFITNGKKGLVAGFRYFDIRETAAVSVTLRGKARGTLEVRVKENGPAVGLIEVTPSDDWKEFTGEVKIPAGVQELWFVYTGRGKLDFLEFRFA